MSMLTLSFIKILIRQEISEYYLIIIIFEYLNIVNKLMHWKK